MAAALVVIDVDATDQWTDEMITRDVAFGNVASAIKKRLRAARQAGELVIFVIYPEHYPDDKPREQFEGTESDCIGCAERELAEFLEHRHGHRDSFEPLFVKRDLSAFSNPCFTEYLGAKGVTELAIAGCAMEACIKVTAQDARQENFKVTILRDCVV